MVISKLVREGEGGLLVLLLPSPSPTVLIWVLKVETGVAVILNLRKHLKII